MSTTARKWAHQGGGIASLAYSPDGTLLYTSGGDFLRVWSGEPDKNDEDALATIDHHDAPVLGIDCSFESLVTACEDGTAALFPHSTHEFASYVTRSDLGSATRSVKFSPNGQRVVVTSDEIDVKVVDVRDISKIQILQGHTKSVRAATWSPDGQLITTSGSDGTIRVWDVSNPAEQEPLCLKVLDGFIGAEEPESEMQCEAVWHPTGRYFVVGTKSHEIAVVSRESWEQEGAFEQGGHAGEISALAFSPNGRYLCSSGRDGAVIVWESTTRRVVLKDQNPNGVVTALAWRPGSGSNTISYLDNVGNLTRWDNIITDDQPHPNDAPPAGSKQAKTSAAAPIRKNKSAPELDDDDLDLDLAGFDDDLGAMDEDDFIEDDEDDGVYQSRRPRGDSLDLPPPLAKGKTSSTVTIGASTRLGSGSLVRGQAPFQPGATPLKDRRRYLDFNMVGVIHIVERDSHNIINVDFHDQTSYPSSHFDDYTKYDLGCLGAHGAVYASSSKDLGSSIRYKPFETWGNGQGEWSLDFPANEQVTVLAIGGSTPGNPHGQEEDEEILGSYTGSGSVAVATNRNFLRLFTASGVQRYVVNFGEEVVTMAAGKEWLLAVHRSTDLVTPGYQDLSYTIIDLDTYEFVQRGKLPLSKGATLKWVGFAADETPFMYSSDGLVSCLDKSRRPGQARWVPMLDTNTLARREGKTESYWPVGMTAESFVCVILKGEEKFPGFPTPIWQELGLQIPLFNTTEQKGEVEAKLLQQSIQASQVRDLLPPSSVRLSDEEYALKEKVRTMDIEVDKSILRLMQLACKADMQREALDLACLLTSTRSFVGAVKLASAYGLNRLKTRFEAMRDVREGVYGDTFKHKAEREKRDGKYAHLVDDRIVPDSTMVISKITSSVSAKGAAASAANLLAKPFDDTRGKTKKTAKSVFSDAPVKAAIADRPSYIASGAGADSDDEPMSMGGHDAGHGMSQDETDVYVDRRRDAESDDDESVTVAATATKPRYNPFAKGMVAPAKANAPAAKPPAPLNPFAKKPAHSGNNSLKKTGSFFDRVDASSGAAAIAGSSSSSSSATTSATSSRQSTLFGLPAKPTEKPQRGRKRKSEGGAGAEGDGDGEDEVTVTTVRKLPKKLDSFFAKGTSASKPAASKAKQAKTAEAELDAEFENGEEAAENDTQVSTQIIENARITEEPEEATAEDVTDGDHSIDTTEPVTPADEDPLDPVEEEDTSSIKVAEPVDGISKLAAFRNPAAGSETV